MKILSSRKPRLMIYNDILKARETGKKLLAVLLDPDKFESETFRESVEMINRSGVDYVFVGGSTVEEGATHQFTELLKRTCLKPIVLFPGEAGQLTAAADAVLFLSLISGRNPEYLIEQQVRAVPMLKNAKLEVIPTGYILVDGGSETSVQHVSKTSPIPSDDVDTIVNTAMAGMYMGKKLIYLEAGSGAKFPVSAEIITSVKKSITIPLIVGGGIRSIEALNLAFDQGADMVVVGTAFEENNDFLQKIVRNERIH